MSTYSNDNISKIAKLTPRELPHQVQNRGNNCTRKIMAYTVAYFWIYFAWPFRKQAAYKQPTRGPTALSPF